MSVFLKQLGVYLSLLAIGASAGIFIGRTLKWLDGSGQNLSVLSLALQQAAPSKNLVLTAGSFASQRAPIENLSSNFITAVAVKVGPAVVRIDAERDVGMLGAEDFATPFFRQFFGEPALEDIAQSSTGAGLIISSEGRIVSNARVVAGAKVVRVTLLDGREFDGKVVGIDPLTDVAAIKINATGLPTIKLGDSSKLVPGQWAIAIGNPLGLDNTVTVGIISALGRSSSDIGIAHKRVRFIQTDAAINPGSSGGPLLNQRGEAIGINTDIRADGQGLGFAIPIETASAIAEHLFATGRASHPFLGISMTNLAPYMQASSLQYPDMQFLDLQPLDVQYPDMQEAISPNQFDNGAVDRDEGILIIGVMKNSPARQAGLLLGDTIEKINGISCATPTDVQELVDASEVGDLLDIEILRHGKLEIIQARIGSFPRELMNSFYMP